MAYPEDRLVKLLECAPNADLSADPDTYTWTPITDALHVSDPLTLKVGGEDEQSTSSTEFEATLRDPDARFDIDNPESDLWPFFDQNIPLRWSIDAGSGLVQRCVVYLSECTPALGQSPHRLLRQIRADGLFRRLQISNAEIKSALRRSIQADDPNASWPLEDKTNSTSVGSGLVGGQRLTASSVTFESSLCPAGSAAAADLRNGGVISGPTGLASGSIASWEYELAVGWETLPTDAADLYHIVTLETPGSTADWWALWLWINGGTVRPAVYYYSPTLGMVGGLGSDPLTAGRVHHLRLHMAQSGGNIAATVWVDGDSDATVTLTSATLTAPTRQWLSGLPEVIVPAPAGYSFPYVTDAAIASASHVALWAPARGSAETWRATDGYAGEQAHERIERVCAEEGVPVATLTATRSTAMGPQPVESLVPVLRDVEKTDHGYLDDSQGRVDYRAQSQTTNLDPALTINTRARQLKVPVLPTRDDQKLRNRIRATRPKGSETTWSDTDSIAKVGVYGADAPVNVETDDQLIHHAGFLVWNGTAPGKRWPQLTLDLQRCPELAANWLAFAQGDRVEVLHVPPGLGRGPLDLQVVGWTETYIKSRGWTTVLNCLPYRGETFVVETGTGNRSRVGSHSAALAAAVAAGDTSLSVTDVRLWTTTATFPNDFPFDAFIGGAFGEQITVRGITGVALSQTWDVARAVNGVRRSWDAGTDIRLVRPAVYGL